MSKQLSKRIDAKNTHHRDQLSDYILPTVQGILSGNNHTDVFKQIAEKLKLTNPSTCYERCTRNLGFKSIFQFLDKIDSGEIKKYLIQKFPERKSLIEKELL